MFSSVLLQGLGTYLSFCFLSNLLYDQPATIIIIVIIIIIIINLSLLARVS